MKLSINGIEFEIEGAERVEVSDGGKRIVVHVQKALQHHNPDRPTVTWTTSASRVWSQALN